MPFDEAITRTKDALSDEGFGILSEIDGGGKSVRIKMQRTVTVAGNHIRNIGHLIAWVAVLLVALTSTASAQLNTGAHDTLRVYGPGGPLPAMKEAAAEFSRRYGVHVEVVGGPTPQWLDKAKMDADIIFSGAEHMMTDFISQLKDGSAGRIDTTTVDPLYIRPSAILVRTGNPRHIRRFEDLLRPGVRILAVQGAGQTGMWEDMAGRTGDISVIRALRKNIGAVASNSAEAKKIWTDDKSYDAWLIWNIWQVANPKLADAVTVAPKWRIYRDCGTALTFGGRNKAAALDFIHYLRSREGARIFAKWGWITSAKRHNP